MIPLLFLALALGAAALTYEVSPGARTWVDEHVHAIRGAFAAHRAADAHLSAAKAAANPVTAVQYAHAARAENRTAAKETAVAAKTARTGPQRTVAAQSAVTVDVREDEITDTLADAHLSAAEVEVDPVAAVQHVHEATTANQAAAQKTAEAAEMARTEQQRAVAAQNAAKVADRQNKITAALGKLGVGQCGVRSYARVTPQIKDALLARLHGEGMTVTGTNPWDIATHKYDVKLRAVWDPQALALKLIVTSGEGGYLGLVTCSAIWDKIEPILKEVVGA